MNRLLLLCVATLAHSSAAAQGWRQYAVPEEAGFSSAGIALAGARAEEIDSAAVMTIYRGHVLFAWGDVERRFKCHSVRKSLLSALIGIHVAEDRIDLEETLADIDIDDKAELTDEEKRARVVDLLRARSGVYHPAAKEPRGMSANRPARGSHAPGTHWWYNNWDFNTLLSIFEQETGTKIFEEFQRRIARPIGMEDYRPRDGYYQLEPSRSLHPAYAFRMSTRDLARFGQLYVAGGEWGDERVVPADWVAESTRPHSTSEGGGYGYMWWSYPASLEGAASLLDRHDKFAARGTGGQFILVVPDAELVFVHRGDTDNDRRVAGAGIWNIAELVLAAKTAEPAADPELGPLRSVPFANPGPTPKERTAIPLSTEELSTFCGRYQIPDMLIDVYLFRDRLFVKSHLGEVELFPETATRFFARGFPLDAEFVRDGESGMAVRGRMRGRQYAGRRL